VGAGPLTDRAVALLTSNVEGQTKTVTLVRDGQLETLRTRAATVADLLLEQNIVLSSEDALDAAPSSPLTEGETLHYQAAVPVNVVVDDVALTVRTTARTVGEILANEQVSFDGHDRVSPSPDAPVTADQTIHVDHVNSWVVSVHSPLRAPVRHMASFDLPIGSVRVVQNGTPGVRETDYLMTRPADRSAGLHRSLLAAHVLRKARPRIVAVGVGEYASLAQLAKRGFDGTIRLAKSALRMVATAYTASCYGCSGMTKSGQPAGHGIVAVDPAVIPLGSHLYIPGYGRATAGDTGGAIRGNRIDLGFNSNTDALNFGVKKILVYFVK
jgi:3D (Asp-Asp-Asp) domain-containing protein